MAFKRILVPTDGSEFIKPATKAAIEMARCFGAKITALYVLDHTVFVNMPLDSAVMNVYSLLEREGKDAVGHVEETAKEAGVEVETKVVEGSPVKVIVDESADHDMIVMGSLGRTGFSKLMMGSVAEKVVRYSHCPVMVVRPPEVERK